MSDYKGLSSLGPGGLESALRARPTPEDIIAALSEACEELSRLLGEELVGLALFGSWARGEAGEESDVDVLVVLRSLRGMDIRSTTYRTIARHVKRALTLVDVRLDEITGDDVVLTPLLINVVADAVVVWDPSGVLSEFVEKGRELIRKAGLVRYRTPDGKYGWKREDGRPLEPVAL